jgi:hypothetical protein
MQAGLSKVLRVSAPARCGVSAGSVSFSPVWLSLAACRPQVGGGRPDFGGGSPHGAGGRPEIAEGFPQVAEGRPGVPGGRPNGAGIPPHFAGIPPQVAGSSPQSAGSPKNYVFDPFLPSSALRDGRMAIFDHANALSA